MWSYSCGGLSMRSGMDRGNERLSSVIDRLTGEHGIAGDTEARFANGISQATKHPNALIAFGFGPRACIGQTFALLEAKMAIALILQRFSLSLSPEYKHHQCPCSFCNHSLPSPLFSNLCADSI
ncbi:hypothetical protein QYF36_011670 [Acer negundo]|nr:hypothetical protein QYF36_011670 [Acer negundo]